MASGGSYVAQRHNSTAPSALAETFSRVGRNDICTCNCSALHAEKSEEMANSVVSKLCWFNSKVLNNPQRPFCHESALFGECSLSFSAYLCQRPSGAVLSGNPHHCALVLPLSHTYTWAPAVLPSGETICVNSRAWCRNWLILGRSSLSSLFLYIAFLLWLCLLLPCWM